jgi:hypothetical protein
MILNFMICACHPGAGGHVYIHEYGQKFFAMPDRHIFQIACQKICQLPDRTRGSAYVSLCQNIFENICWIAKINTGKDLLDTDARQNA